MTTQTEALKRIAAYPFARAEELSVEQMREIAREALAQPEQEPVAQCTESDSWNCKYCRKTESCKALQDPRNFTTPPQRKPWVSLTDEDAAAIAYKGFDDYWTEDCKGRDVEAWTASGRAIEAKLRELNEAPQRKPLTDEQINEIATEVYGASHSDDWKFARAIEAAHGIKGDA